MALPARSLAFRLALILSASLILLLAVFGYWAVHETQSRLEGIVLSSGQRCCDVIRRSTRFSMLRNERDSITEIVRSIGDHPGLDQIRIFDARGRIHYSTKHTDLNQTVDETTEACVVCHGGVSEPPKVTPAKTYRIFERPDGHRTMGIIAPIRNEKACSEAACHAHDADQRILGVLDVQMSLDPVDKIVVQHTRQMTYFLGIVVVVLVIFMTLILLNMVHRPILKLIDGTKRVAAGDLRYRIRMEAQGEVKELADSFNAMTDELSAAREQSDAWAEALESRVEEKSRALQKIQEESVQMEKMASMGKLAAIVAHEINNPLAGIRTYARLLLKRSMRDAEAGEPAVEKDNRAERDEILTQIEAEATRCGEIVKHLLQFSRPSRPQTEPCDINDLIRSSARLVQHQVDLKGLSSEVELSEDLPRIICDPQQIRQVLVAVLINACDAMSGGGIVRTVTEAGPDGSALVTISDTGSGIDDETRKHIFEPFYTTKEGGAGLGLSVVYGIIQSHGGRIDVDSEQGKGTTFRFHLPAKPPERGPEGEVNA